MNQASFDLHHNQQQHHPYQQYFHYSEQNYNNNNNEKKMSKTSGSSHRGRVDDKHHQQQSIKQVRLVCSSGDDLAYLFGDPILQGQTLSSLSSSNINIHLGPFYHSFNLTRVHASISEMFIQYIVNFVRTG